MGEEEKNNNINHEIKDTEDKGLLGTENSGAEEKSLKPENGGVEDKDDAAVESSSLGKTTEGVTEEITAEENTTKDDSDTVTTDSASEDTIEEAIEENSIWNTNDDLTAKADLKGSDINENIEQVFKGKESTDDITVKGVTIEETTTADITTTDSSTINSSIEDPAVEESEYKDKWKIALRFSVFSKLFSSLSILVDVIKRKYNKFPSIKEKCLLLINIVKDLKGRVPTFKDKNLIKVFSNPWVIANGVVLIVALSITVVIVSWFKTRTNKINDALTDLAQLQFKSTKDKTSIGHRKITVQPFIVKEEAFKEKKPDTVGVSKRLRWDQDFESLLESAEQSFRRGEYQRALAFYSALVTDDSDLSDKSFLNLRIGECYFYSGLYNEAIEAFNAVLFAKVGDEKNKWHSKYLLAECYMMLGDYDNGRKTLYALMALGGDFSPDMTDLVERIYFRIADSYLEETQAKLWIKD